MKLEVNIKTCPDKKLNLCVVELVYLLHGEYFEWKEGFPLFVYLVNVALCYLV